MAVTADRYAAQLAALLPVGALWRALRGDALFAGLLRAIADGLARVHERIESLRREADPRTTAEQLAEWETSVGLPDDCLPTEGSAEERRAAVLARLRATGGASAQYYIDVAAAMGVVITIDYPALHTWRITSDQAVATRLFRAGLSRAGEPLAAYGNEQFECLFNRIKPAHTVLQFAYPS